MPSSSATQGASDRARVAWLVERREHKMSDLPAEQLEKPGVAMVIAQFNRHDESA